MKKFVQCLLICSVIDFTNGCGRVRERQLPNAEAAATQPPVHRIYAVEWINHDIPQTMSAGDHATIHVSGKNTGDWIWLNPSEANPSRPDGRYAVRLCYRWTTSDSQLFPQESGRGDLQMPVGPGKVANFTMDVIAPEDANRYELQIDLVEELVTFFSTRGAEKLRVPVIVQ